VVDDSLGQQQDLYLEGGDHAHLVHINGTDFRNLMQGAQHGRFTGRA
jgi:Ala-tRNA(Pro) deacylase